MILYHEIIANSPVIARELRRLASLEEQLQARLSPQSLYHPGLRIGIKFPSRKMRDYVILWEARQFLPITIRLEVENLFARHSKLHWKEREILLSFRDKFLVKQDARFLNGRAKERLIWLLQNIRINLIFPKKPKTVQRPRGYKDHGTMRNEAVSARLAADLRGYREEAERNQYYNNRAEQLTRATEILELERQGVPVDVIQGASATADSTEHTDVNGSSHPESTEVSKCTNTYILENLKDLEFERIPCEFCPPSTRKECKAFLLLCEKASLDPESV